MLQLDPIVYVILVLVPLVDVDPLVDTVPFVDVLVLPVVVVLVVVVVVLPAAELLVVVLDDVVAFEDEVVLAALMDNTRKLRARTVKIDLIVVLKIIISFLKSSTI